MTRNENEKIDLYMMCRLSVSCGRAETDKVINHEGSETCELNAINIVVFKRFGVATPNPGPRTCSGLTVKNIRCLTTRS